MPRLIVMRHAKSSHDDPALTDLERPLAPRGERAAARMGRWLARVGAAPDLVLVSPARRARETAGILVAEGRIGTKPVVEPVLYPGEPRDVAARLARVALQVERLLIIGHDPHGSELIALLSGARVRMPTAAAAEIELPGPGWQRAAEGGGVLRWLLTPKLVGKSAGAW